MARARPIPKCEQRPEWLQRQERAQVVLDLPLCPATNNLYANVPGRGRVKTRAYKSWLTQAMLFGQVQRPGRIVGLADLTIHLPAFRGDTDGRVKAAIDAAKAIGVVADDGKRYLRHEFIRRDEAPEGFMRLVFTRVILDAPTAEPVEEAA
jgi:hypothetical protein